jgi:hypothetical protein
VVAGHRAPSGDLGAAHLEHVLVRGKADLVVDAHRRDDRPEVGGDLAAHRPTRCSSEPPRRAVDERHEAEADAQLERSICSAERLVAGRGRQRRGRRARRGGGARPASARLQAPPRKKKRRR